MPTWDDEQVAKLKRYFVGGEEDFRKFLAYAKSAWTTADLEKLERGGLLVTWDHYFGREKIIVNMLDPADNVRRGKGV